MFRKEFSEVIAQTGMIPLKDVRPLLMNRDPAQVTELELLKYSFFNDIKFAQNLSEKFGIPFLDLGEAKIDDKSIALLKRPDVVRYRVIPIKKSMRSVVLAIYDPSVRDSLNDLKNILQHNVEFILTNLGSWAKIFERVRESLDDLAGSVKEIVGDSVIADDKDKFDPASIDEDIVVTVNRILAESFVKKASDIHIEPYEKRFRIRFRIDGVLLEAMVLSKNLAPPLCSRVKIMAQMDIAERRKPQDGRIKLQIGTKSIDYRVSSLPTLFGEKIVLRLLDNTNLQLDMTKLGFEDNQLEIFKRNINRPYGMCFVTGPTGSGKTTTLYSALTELNSSEVNISTIEDPVEFNLEGINQVNLRKEAGMTFAKALKAFLRQDPDIIMVGEVRDLETAEVAVEAALTGHLVLSTLHTNDAPSTVIRLLNMGLEPFLITGALNVVVAQRLCRKICTQCKKEIQVLKDELIALGFGAKAADQVKIYKGEGCTHCNGTGYKGRIAIYEVLELTSTLKELILRNPSAEDLKRLAIKEGMKTLRMTALTKVHQGLTTIEEAVSNSSTDKL